MEAGGTAFRRYVRSLRAQTLAAGRRARRQLLWASPTARADRRPLSAPRRAGRLRSTLPIGVRRRIRDHRMGVCAQPWSRTGASARPPGGSQRRGRGRLHDPACCPRRNRLRHRSHRRARPEHPGARCFPHGDHLGPRRPADVRKHPCRVRAGCDPTPSGSAKECASVDSAWMWRGRSLRTASCT